MTADIGHPHDEFEKEQINMSSTKMVGKTIGEVEKFTGIPRRTLKYFIERDIMHPSCKSESGYWLYTEEDVRITQIIALLRNLGYRLGI